MNKSKILSFIFIVSVVLSPQVAFSESSISVTEIEWISDLIFENECDRATECLIAWNEGEQFLSLGIGHFIWYPVLSNGPFTESFPQLLSFIESKGVALPSWFQYLPNRQLPWLHRNDFLEVLNQGRLEFLRDFLIQTKPLQAEFMVQRFSQSVPKILQAAAPETRAEIQQKLILMINSKNGLYPLVDYVNFNGEGISESERYNGQGWGLLQVLGQMNMPTTETEIVSEFVNAALVVLDRRVANSPKERNEKRWLPGWRNRMNTYLTAGTDIEVVSNGFLREMLLSAILGSQQLLDQSEFIATSQRV